MLQLHKHGIIPIPTLDNALKLLGRMAVWEESRNAYLGILLTMASTVMQSIQMSVSGRHCPSGLQCPARMGAAPRHWAEQS